VVVAAQVFEFVKLAELYYAGSHGMDIKGPAKGSRHTKAAKVPIHPSNLCCCHFRIVSAHPPRKGEDTYLCSAPLCGSQAKGVLFQPASQFLPMIEQVTLTDACMVLPMATCWLPAFRSAMLNFVKFLVCLSLDQVHDSLVEKTKCIPGAKVENNKFCVSVHFRCVDEKVVDHTLSFSLHSHIYMLYIEFNSASFFLSN
jgi:trehalose 6-phosphate phosphatase